MILLMTIAVVIWLQYAYVKDNSTAFELSQEPVIAYIQQCLTDVAKEAVLKAGQHGGYIYMNKLAEDEREIAQLIPFNSDVFINANGKQQLPYWYYQQNDGFDRITIPELEMKYVGDDSIQEQIERYITERLPTCLNNFTALENSGISIKYDGEYAITSKILDESIEVIADLPLTVTEEGTITEMNKFAVSFPVGLKKTYELARDITEHELDTLFLEQSTRNLLSMYGQVDKKYLPPMAGGIHFEACSERQFWFYTDVERNVRTMLAANIPYLHVANTEFDKIKITDNMEADEERKNLRQAVMDKFIIHPTKEDYSGITATFNYQATWPMELVFGNNLGYGLIQPNDFEINVLVANFCMFDYSFLYNLKYPVLITLTDAATDINGNAFVFQFPLQVVIKNNYPRIKLNDVLRYDYNIPETAPAEPTWQCEPRQRLSGESSIAVETADNIPVADAVVTFQCGPSYVYKFNSNGTVESVEPFAKTCFMGTTDTSGELITPFPPCIGGGMITVQHKDYVEKSVASGNIRQGISFEKNITLDKVYTMKVDVQKYFTPAPSITNDEGIGIHLDENGNVVACNLNLDPKKLQPYESAVITLTKLDLENGVVNHVPIVIYDPNNEENNKDPATIDIAPGKYAVDILLLREERYPGEMTIRANSESITVTTTFDEDVITYPEEDVLIERTFTGGALYEWNVTDAELTFGNTITFFIFDEDIPTKIEEISSSLQHREECSELEWNMIRPRVK